MYLFISCLFDYFQWNFFLFGFKTATFNFFVISKISTKLFSLLLMLDFLFVCSFVVFSRIYFVFVFFYLTRCNWLVLYHVLELNLISNHLVVGFYVCVSMFVCGLCLCVWTFIGKNVYVVCGCMYKSIGIQNWN